jgi:hypothetical protein
MIIALYIVVAAIMGLDTFGKFVPAFSGVARQ